MDMDDIIRHETIRMKIYMRLARSYHLPDEKLPGVVKKLSEDLLYVNPALFSQLIFTEKQLRTSLDPEVLLIDYSRLFVGPYRLLSPPYGSVYLEPEPKVMGESTMDVLERYSRFDIKVADQFTDVPDHIAAELEFMSVLVYKEIESVQACDLNHVCDVILEQQRFSNEHLTVWIPDFTALAAQHAQTSFYRKLAKITGHFIDLDTAYLNEIPIPVTKKQEKV